MLGEGEVVEEIVEEIVKEIVEGIGRLCSGACGEEGREWDDSL